MKIVPKTTLDRRSHKYAREIAKVEFPTQFSEWLEKPHGHVYNNICNAIAVAYRRGVRDAERASGNSND